MHPTYYTTTAQALEVVGLVSPKGQVRASPWEGPRWRWRLRVRAARRLGWQVRVLGRCARCGKGEGLPAGLTCGQCAFVRTCDTLFGGDTANTECQFYPSRFERWKVPIPTEATDAL